MGTIKDKTSKEWKIAGVVVYIDTNHYLHFALVETPDDMGCRHFIELVEQYEGRWLANCEGKTNEKEWFFNGYYHYPVPAIGGDSSDNEVGGVGIWLD